MKCPKVLLDKHKLKVHAFFYGIQVLIDIALIRQVKSIAVESPLTSIDVKSDGVTVAVGSTRGKVFVYDLRKATAPINVFNAHRASVQRLKFEHRSTVAY